MTAPTDGAHISEFRGSHGFLSNFFSHPVAAQVHGRSVVAPTAEHAFQAMKAERREDAERILRAKSPGEAKRLGRAVAMREDWDEVRLAAMSQVLRVKFASGSNLAQQLLDTGNATLREGNTWNDTFWGVARDPNEGWRGANWLGRLLMLQRSMLRWEQGSTR